MSVNDSSVLRGGPSTSSVPPQDERAGGKHPGAKRPPRRDEWTRAKMVAFLREVAACRSVSQAAKSVGMSRQSAYKLRTRLAGTPFAMAWQVALGGARGAVSRRGVSPGREAAFSTLAR